MPPPPYLSFDPATRRLRLDPHEENFFQNPYEAYAWLHGQGGAFFWEEFGFWCFGGFDDVSRLLRDRRFGRQNPVGIPDSRGVGEDRSHLASFDAVEANSMLELEPPVHTRLRTLVNRAFVSRQVERLRPRVEALANELIDRFPDGEPVDLLPAFAAPLPITIIAEMLGVPVEMGPQLLDWSHRMVAMYMHGRTRETEATANRAAREFSDFLRGYLAERRKKPGDDLLSLLISAQEDGQKLTEDELVSSTILLLNAGHEATVHQTGNAVRTILAQGGDARRFFATPEATAATVEECLRFDAPLHMFTRYAYGEMEIAPGVTVKSGETGRPAARHGEPRSSRLRRSRGLQAGPSRPEERILRRRHPFLHRRAAGPARTAGGAESAVRPAAAAAPRRGAALPRHLAFPWAGAAGVPC